MNDSFAIIDKIISALLNGVKKTLVEDIENAKIYQKYVFNGDNNLECIAHWIDFALGEKDVPADTIATC